MAEILELETKEPVIAKVSEIQKAAEELKKRTELPKKPGDRVQPRELHDWLKLLTPEMEQQIVIYAYRLDPPIIRQKTNPDAPNNIDVLSDGYKTLDIERYLIDTQGGGKYQLIVKNQGYKPKAKADNGGYFECMVTIPFNLHPIKLAHRDGIGLDLREVDWENSKANNFKEWAKAQGLIDKDCKIMEQGKVANGTTVVNGGIDPTTFKMMLDFTAKMSEKEQLALKKQIGGDDALSKSMGDLMLEKMKQEDPNKATASMIQLITAMKTMAPEVKQDNTMATILPLLIKMMDDSRAAADRQMTMFMEMFKQNNKPEKEEGTDKISELKAIIELAREIKGGGGSSHEKSTTESLIELGSNVLPGVLNIIGNMTAMNAAAKGIKTTPIVETNPQGVNNFRSLHEQNTMNQPQQQPMQNGTPQLNTNEAANLIQQFGPIIINKLGSDGWEFAAWVSEGFGDVAAATLAKYGPDELLKAAKSVPQFWQQVENSYGEAHMKKWLASLCNYKEIMTQMEAEENGEEEKIQ